MSDAAIRALERRWRETGAEADEVAWLRARVQAGEVEEPRLRLAARLGQPAARLVLAGESDPIATVLSMAAAMPDHDSELRVALAALREAWRTHEGTWEKYPGGVGLIRSLFEAIEAWVQCPCERHLARVDQSTRGRIMIGLPDVLFRRAGEATDALYELARGIDSHWSPDLCEACLRASLAGGSFREHVLEPAQRELIPWLLGYGDPIAARVESAASGQPD